MKIIPIWLLFALILEKMIIYQIVELQVLLIYPKTLFELDGIRKREVASRRSG